MSVTAIVHLNFSGEAREALEFYRSVFGGQLEITTYADAGAPVGSPDADAITFGQLTADMGLRMIAYDVPTSGRSTALAGSVGERSRTYRDGSDTITGERFFVALRGDDVEEIRQQWNVLADRATIVEPLAPSSWAPLFGMLTDRFGITWSIAAENTRPAGRQAISSALQDARQLPMSE